MQISLHSFRFVMQLLFLQRDLAGICRKSCGVSAVIARHAGKFLKRKGHYLRVASWIMEVKRKNSDVF